MIQYLYDSHYEGAATAAGYAPQWESLRGRIDDQRYFEVLAQLRYQGGQAEVWRDAVTNWFLRTSGIPDNKGRVGHYPGRTEAESMKLDGYRPVDVTPWETASGGKAIACDRSHCAASFAWKGAPHWYTIRVQYFDQNNGISKFRLRVAGQVVDEWEATDRIRTKKMDGSSSTRREITGIALRPGDEIRIEGTPDNEEPAGVDYIEVLPE